jgi:hypothetical protein
MSNILPTPSVALAFVFVIFNVSTREPVIVSEAFATRDDAKRALQSFLIDEANAQTEELDANILDNAAQQLNYADSVHIGDTFDWACTVEDSQAWHPRRTY